MLFLRGFYVMRTLFRLYTIAQKCQQIASKVLWRVLAFYKIAPCLSQKHQKKRTLMFANQFL